MIRPFGAFGERRTTRSSQSIIQGSHELHTNFEDILICQIPSKEIKRVRTSLLHHDQSAPNPLPTTVTPRINGKDWLCRGPTLQNQKRR
jgi:hypothetical protein